MSVLDDDTSLFSGSHDFSNIHKFDAIWGDWYNIIIPYPFVCSLGESNFMRKKHIPIYKLAFYYLPSYMHGTWRRLSAPNK